MSRASAIQGILLAAGRASRYGANKLLAPLPDGTPVAVAAARALAAALPGALAVVNGDDAALAQRLEALGLRVGVCPVADLGMGASLAWGVAQTPEADGWLIALADMPWIAPGTLRMVARAVARPEAIAAPYYLGRRGHPVAFGAAYYKELTGLSGDMGARAVLEAHRRNHVAVACADPGVLRDIDTPEDLNWVELKA